MDQGRSTSSPNLRLRAFRVSDRSGTPQAGNPAEEYSEERDPAAFEPGHAHPSILLRVGISPFHPPSPFRTPQHPGPEHETTFVTFSYTFVLQTIAR
jgi:hypothetical protein